MARGEHVRSVHTGLTAKPPYPAERCTVGDCKG